MFVTTPDTDTDAVGKLFDCFKNVRVITVPNKGRDIGAFLTGLWHGAAWNFVLWGVWNGVFLMFERAVQFDKRVTSAVIRHIYTLLVVVVGMVIFRTTDAIVHVVRCFEDANVTHVEGSTDPLRDIDIINLELVMADIEMVERRIDKCQKAAKGGDKRFLKEAELFTDLLAHLNQGKLARTFECSEEDMALIATSDLLTLKKTIYVANLAENEVNDPEVLRDHLLLRDKCDELDDTRFHQQELYDEWEKLAEEQDRMDAESDS